MSVWHACLANSPKLLALSPPFQALQGAMCPLFSLLLSNLSRCTVEDWRLKWGLTQLEGAGEADVSEALHSPSEGVRLNALYHCAKLAMALQTSAHKHTRRRSSVRVGEGQREGDRFSPLCVYVAPVERLFKDNSLSVRVASAVWLTVVGQWSDKVLSGACMHVCIGMN